MVEFSTILQFIQASGIIVGVAYYIMNIQNNQRNQQLTLETRQAQLLMQIYDKVNNKEFTQDWAEINYFWKWKDSKEYWEKYGTNLEVYPKFQNVANTYEGIGFILQSKLVDPKLIYGILRNTPILIWEKFSPMIKEYSEKADEPTLFPGFEFLYEELSKQYELEHGHKFVHNIRLAEELR
ncbi:DUF4760 domain-containing protein [Candidatus Bathyarchaeota archaeon]|nr:MAG: DUF4760 domain-containing protein [Candidatus Bathyarchaeota archaeon]